MSYTNPTIVDFKAQFTRDFVYGSDNTTVQDSDITTALNYAAINFDPGLFGTQTAYTLGFCLVAAHYLCMNLRAATQGLSGQFSWLVSSKGVGSVSLGSSIPQRILDNPMWSYLSKTEYGAEYLSIVMPSLCAQVFTVCGTTKPL